MLHFRLLDSSLFLKKKIHHWPILSDIKVAKTNFWGFKKHTLKSSLAHISFVFSYQSVPSG
jgi:hypothetical protein